MLSFVQLPRLEEVIAQSWGPDTCNRTQAPEYLHHHPSYGQDIVTALVVQDYFGGHILHNDHLKHYWNALPTGQYIDLTKAQFPRDMQLQSHGVQSREHLLLTRNAHHEDIPEHYAILRQRVAHALGHELGAAVVS